MNSGLKTKTLFILAALLFSTIAFAHPGHDHSHWMSKTIHIVLLVSLLGAAVYGIAALVRLGALKQDEKGEKHDK